VSLNGITANGSASEARLKIGNLTAADLLNCKTLLSVRATKDGDFTPSALVSIPGTLRAGAFDLKTLPIPDTKPEDVSAIRLSTLMCGTVQLRSEIP
jgi:hypothetical protein